MLQIRHIHYAWVILFLTFLGLLAVQGTRLSFGAFMQPWEQEFTTDRGTISLISMVSFIIYGLSQPIIGKLIDRFGVRKILSTSAFLVGFSLFMTSFATSTWQLFIIYGIVASLGFGGVSNVATTVIVMNWFNKKRGMAFGLMEAGVGVGQMLIVPASLFFIEWYGWQQTVVYLGCFLTFIVFPLLLFFLRNSPSAKGLQALGGTSIEDAQDKENEKEETIAFWHVLRTRPFWFLVLPFFICGFTTSGLIDTHLIPLSHDHGFSTDITGAAVSLLAAFNIIGILLSGVIADRWSSRKMLAILYGSRGVSLIILLYTQQPYLLLIFAVLYGLVDFATVAPTQLLATKYFKRYSIGFILGWLFFSHQFGSALGAYIPGLLYDLQGGYDSTFYMAILLCAIASVLSFLLPRSSPFTKKMQVDGRTTADI